jgi:hypothetical protein
VTLIEVDRPTLPLRGSFRRVSEVALAREEGVRYPQLVAEVQQEIE